MTSSDIPAEMPRRAPVSERRLRWIALVSLVILIPATIAATGWRDRREINRSLELQPIDVREGAKTDYSRAKIGLVAINAIPWEKGLPEDRTFVRTRLTVEPLRAGTPWLDCKLNVVDRAGHSWSAIDEPPALVQHMLAKPGEPAGTICGGLAVSNAKPGSTIVVDAYYLVPRPIPALSVTLSTMDGRPNYLRFAVSKVQ